MNQNLRKDQIEEVRNIFSAYLEKKDLRKTNERIKTGRGIWVKQYDNARRYGQDAQRMVASGWSMVSQTSTDLRARIVVTWQR